MSTRQASSHIGKLWHSILLACWFANFVTNSFGSSPEPDCSSLNTRDCVGVTGCFVQVGEDGVQRCQQTSTVNVQYCDVQLDFTIPYPFGCPADECVIRQLTNKYEYCDARNFWDSFQTIYWGQSGLPYGYLIWNILLGLVILLLISLTPRILGFFVSKIVTGMVLKPQEPGQVPSAFRVGSLGVSVLGGKITLYDIEYISTNCRVRIVEASIEIKWFLSENSVLHDISKLGGSSHTKKQQHGSYISTTKSNNGFFDEPFNMKGEEQRNEYVKPAVGGSRHRQPNLPFRLSVYTHGLEMSIYNNGERYDQVAHFINKAECAAGNTPSMRLGSTYRGAKSAKENVKGVAEANKDYQNFQPLFYRLFPISKFVSKESCVYIGAENLPTTMVLHVQRVYGLHFIEEIPDDNKDLDLYRVSNKMVLSQVKVTMSENDRFKLTSALFHGSTPARELPFRENIGHTLQTVFRTTFDKFRTTITDIREVVEEDILMKSNSETVDSKAVPSSPSQLYSPENSLSMDGFPNTVSGSSAGMSGKLVNARTSQQRVTFAGDGDFSLQSELANAVNGVGTAVNNLKNALTGQHSRVSSSEWSHSEPHEKGEVYDLESATNYELMRTGAIPPENPTREHGESVSVGGVSYGSETDENEFASSDSDGEIHYEDGTTFATPFVLREGGSKLYATFGKRNRRPRGSIVEPSILETRRIEIVYYYDQPGTVTSEQLEYVSSPPKAGAKLFIGDQGGDDTVLTYGPWADKQRKRFMDHLFPFAYQNEKPYQPEIGQLRVAQYFQLGIKFVENILWRIPYRARDDYEESLEGEPVSEIVDAVSEFVHQSKTLERNLPDFDWTSVPLTPIAQFRSTNSKLSMMLGHGGCNCPSWLLDKNGHSTVTQMHMLSETQQTQVLSVIRYQIALVHFTRWASALNCSWDSFFVKHQHTGDWDGANGLGGSLVGVGSSGGKVESFTLSFAENIPILIWELYAGREQLLTRDLKLWLQKHARCRGDSGGAIYSRRRSSTDRPIHHHHHNPTNIPVDVENQDPNSSSSSIPKPTDTKPNITNNTRNKQTRDTDSKHSLEDDEDDTSGKSVIIPASELQRQLKKLDCDASQIPNNSYFAKACNTFVNEFIPDKAESISQSLQFFAGNELEIVKILQHIVGPTAATGPLKLLAHIAQDPSFRLPFLLHGIDRRYEELRRYFTFGNWTSSRTSPKHPRHVSLGSRADVSSQAREQSTASSDAGSAGLEAHSEESVRQVEFGEQRNEKADITTRQEQGNTGGTSADVRILSQHVGPLSFASFSGLVCGWVDISAARGSTVEYRIPLVPMHEKGEAALVNLELVKPRVRSSVTDSRVLEAPRATFRGMLHYPNEWTATHTWQFGLQFQTPRVSILKQHVQVFSDLSWDWSSNSEVEPYVELFTPMQYVFRIEMLQAMVILNVNPDNVISLPNHAEYNNHVQLHLPRLMAKISTKYLSFQAPSNQVDWEVEVNADEEWKNPCLASLSFPHNHHRRRIPRPNGFGKGSRGFHHPTFMRFNQLKFQGAYHYHTRVSDQWRDTNMIDIHFDKLNFVAYPEAVQAMLNFRSNYFGSTATPIRGDEYAACGFSNLKARIANRTWYQTRNSTILPKRWNSSEIVLGMTFANPVIQIPIVLYPRVNVRGELQAPATESIRIALEAISVQMRYHLERSLDISITVQPGSIVIPSKQTRTRGRFRDRGTWGSIAPLSHYTFRTHNNSTSYGLRGIPNRSNNNTTTKLFEPQDFEEQSELANQNGDLGQFPDPFYWDASKDETFAGDTDGEYNADHSMRSSVFEQTPSLNHQNPREQSGWHGGLPREKEVQTGKSTIGTHDGVIYWDGMSFNTNTLYGSLPTPTAPAAALHHDQKLELGRIDGDLQESQLSTAIDTLGAFEHGWKMTSKPQAQEYQERLRQFEEAKQPCALRVVLFEGSSIPVEYGNSRTQPCTWAECLLEGQLFRSQLVPDTSTPQWNSTHDFQVPESVSPLLIRVYEGSYGRRLLVGEVNIPGNSLHTAYRSAQEGAPPRSEWFNLEGSRSDSSFNAVAWKPAFEKQRLGHRGRNYVPENTLALIDHNAQHPRMVLTDTRGHAAKIRIRVQWVFPSELRSQDSHHRNAYIPSEYLYACSKWYGIAHHFDDMLNGGEDVRNAFGQQANANNGTSTSNQFVSSDTSSPNRSQTNQTTTTTEPPTSPSREASVGSAPQTNTKENVESSNSSTTGSVGGQGTGSYSSPWVITGDLKPGALQTYSTSPSHGLSVMTRASASNPSSHFLHRALVIAEAIETDVSVGTIYNEFAAGKVHVQVGSIDVSVWSPRGDGVLHFKCGTQEMKGNSYIQPSHTWKFYSVIPSSLQIEYLVPMSSKNYISECHHQTHDRARVVPWRRQQFRSQFQRKHHATTSFIADSCCEEVLNQETNPPAGSFPRRHDQKVPEPSPVRNVTPTDVPLNSDPRMYLPIHQVPNTVWCQVANLKVEWNTSLYDVTPRSSQLMRRQHTYLSLLNMARHRRMNQFSEVTTGVGNPAVMLKHMHENYATVHTVPSSDPWVSRKRRISTKPETPRAPSTKRGPKPSYEKARLTGLFLTPTHIRSHSSVVPRPNDGDETATPSKTTTQHVNQKVAKVVVQEQVKKTDKTSVQNSGAFSDPESVVSNNDVSNNRGSSHIKPTWNNNRERRYGSDSEFDSPPHGRITLKRDRIQGGETVSTAASTIGANSVPSEHLETTSQVDHIGGMVSLERTPSSGSRSSGEASAIGEDDFDSELDQPESISDGDFVDTTSDQGSIGLLMEECSSSSSSSGDNVGFTPDEDEEEAVEGDAHEDDDEWCPTDDGDTTNSERGTSNPAEHAHGRTRHMGYDRRFDPKFHRFVSMPRDEVHNPTMSLYTLLPFLQPFRLEQDLLPFGFEFGARTQQEQRALSMVHSKLIPLTPGGGSSHTPPSRFAQTSNPFQVNKDENAKKGDGVVDSEDSQIQRRTHIQVMNEIEVFMTPIALEYLREIVEHIVLVSPTVDDMCDYFQKEYLSWAQDSKGDKVFGQSTHTVVQIPSLRAEFMFAVSTAEMRTGDPLDHLSTKSHIKPQHRNQAGVKTGLKGNGQHSFKAHKRLSRSAAACAILHIRDVTFTDHSVVQDQQGFQKVNLNLRGGIHTQFSVMEHSNNRGAATQSEPSANQSIRRSEIPMTICATDPRNNNVYISRNNKQISSVVLLQAQVPSAQFCNMSITRRCAADRYGFPTTFKNSNSSTMYSHNAGLLTVSDTCTDIAPITLTCRADSVNAVYTMALLVLDCLLPTIELMSAGPHRMKQQWAVIAGRILKLQGRLDGIVELEKEPIQVRQLFDACQSCETWSYDFLGSRGDAYHLAVIARMRNIAYALPEWEQVESELNNVQYDRYSLKNPVPLGIIARASPVLRNDQGLSQQELLNTTPASVPGSHGMQYGARRIDYAALFHELISRFDQRVVNQVNGVPGKSPVQVEQTVSVVVHGFQGAVAGTGARISCGCWSSDISDKCVNDSEWKPIGSGLCIALVVGKTTASNTTKRTESKEAVRLNATAHLAEFEMNPDASFRSTEFPTGSMHTYSRKMWPTIEISHDVACFSQGVNVVAAPEGLVTLRFIDNIAAHVSDLSALRQADLKSVMHLHFIANQSGQIEHSELDANTEFRVNPSNKGLWFGAGQHSAHHFATGKRDWSYLNTDKGTNGSNVVSGSNGVGSGNVTNFNNPDDGAWDKVAPGAMDLNKNWNQIEREYWSPNEDQVGNLGDVTSALGKDTRAGRKGRRTRGSTRGRNRRSSSSKLNQTSRSQPWSPNRSNRVVSKKVSSSSYGPGTLQIIDVDENEQDETRENNPVQGETRRRGYSAGAFDEENGPVGQTSESLDTFDGQGRLPERYGMQNRPARSSVYGYQTTGVSRIGYGNNESIKRLGSSKLLLNTDEAIPDNQFTTARSMGADSKTLRGNRYDPVQQDVVNENGRGGTDPWGLESQTSSLGKSTYSNWGESWGGSSRWGTSDESSVWSRSIWGAQHDPGSFRGDVEVHDDDGEMISSIGSSNVSIQIQVGLESAQVNLTDKVFSGKKHGFYEINFEIDEKLVLEVIMGNVSFSISQLSRLAQLRISHEKVVNTAAAPSQRRRRGHERHVSADSGLMSESLQWQTSKQTSNDGTNSQNTSQMKGVSRQVPMFQTFGFATAKSVSVRACGKTQQSFRGRTNVQRHNKLNLEKVDWEILARFEDFLVNGTISESMNHNSKAETRKPVGKLFLDVGDSGFEIPLHLTDSNAIQEFMDSWLRYYTFANRFSLYFFERHDTKHSSKKQRIDLEHHREAMEKKDPNTRTEQVVQETTSNTLQHSDTNVDLKQDATETKNDLTKQAKRPWSLSRAELHGMAESVQNTIGSTQAEFVGHHSSTGTETGTERTLPGDNSLAQSSSWFSREKPRFEWSGSVRMCKGTRLVAQLSPALYSTYDVSSVTLLVSQGKVRHHGSSSSSKPASSQSRHGVIHASRKDHWKAYLKVGVCSLSFEKLRTVPGEVKPVRVDVFKQALPSCWLIGDYEDDDHKHYTTVGSKYNDFRGEGDGYGTSDSQGVGRTRFSSDDYSVSSFSQMSDTEGDTSGAPRGHMLHHHHSHNNNLKPKRLGVALVRVKILVAAMHNSFTPAIVRHFLTLQSTLATELNLLLESLTKFADRYHIQKGQEKIRKDTNRKYNKEHSYRPGWLSSKVPATTTPKHIHGGGNVTSSRDGTPLATKKESPVRKNLSAETGSNDKSSKTKVINDPSEYERQFEYQINFFMEGISFKALMEQVLQNESGVESSAERDKISTTTTGLGGAANNASHRNSTNALAYWAELHTGGFDLKLNLKPGTHYPKPISMGNQWLVNVKFQGLRAEVNRSSRISQRPLPGDKGEPTASGTSDTSTSKVELFKVQTNVYIEHKPIAEVAKAQTSKTGELPSLSSNGKNPRDVAAYRTITFRVDHTGIIIRPGVVEASQLISNQYSRAYTWYKNFGRRRLSAPSPVTNAFAKHDTSGLYGEETVGDLNKNVLRVWTNMKDPLQHEIMMEAERFLGNQDFSRVAVRVFVVNSSTCIPFLYRNVLEVDRSKQPEVPAGLSSFVRNEMDTTEFNRVGALLCSLHRIEACFHLDNLFSEPSRAHRLTGDLPSKSPALTGRSLTTDTVGFGTKQQRGVVVGYLEYHDLVTSFVPDGSKLLAEPWVDTGLHATAQCIARFPTMAASVFAEVPRASSQQSSNPGNSVSEVGESPVSPIVVQSIATVAGPRIETDASIIHHLVGLKKTYSTFLDPAEESGDVNDTPGIPQSKRESSNEQGGTGTTPIPEDDEIALDPVIDEDDDDGTQVASVVPFVFETTVHLHPGLLELFSVPLQNGEVYNDEYVDPTLNQASSPTNIPPAPTSRVARAGQRDFPSPENRNGSSKPNAQQSRDVDRTLLYTLQMPSMSLTSHVERQLASSFDGNSPVNTSTVPSNPANDGVTQSSSSSLTKIRLNLEMSMTDVEVSPIVLVCFKQMMLEFERAGLDSNATKRQKYRSKYGRRSNRKSESDGTKEESTSSPTNVSKEVANTHQDMVEWFVTVRVTPMDIRATCEPVVDDVSVRLSLSSPADLCWSSGPMAMEDIGLVLLLTCTTVHIPEIELNVNEPASFLSFRVNGTRAHINQAFGLREDMSAFCTSVVDIERIDSALDLWKSGSFFTFAQGWKIKWKEAMSEIEAATQLHQRFMHNADPSVDHGLRNPTMSGAYYPGMSTGAQESETRTNSRQGAKKRSPLTLAASSVEWLKQSVLQEIARESPTLFMEVRIKQTRLRANLGSLLATSVLEIDGLASRFMEPGDAKGLRKEDMVHLFVHTDAVSVDLNGRIQGNLSVVPGLRLHLIRDYASMANLLDPFQVDESMFRESLETVLAWQPWIIEQRALNLFRLEFGSASLRLAQGLMDSSHKVRKTAGLDDESSRNHASSRLRTMLKVRLDQVLLEGQDDIDAEQLSIITASSLFLNAVDIQSSSETIQFLTDIISNMKLQLKEAQQKSSLYTNRRKIRRRSHTSRSIGHSEDGASVHTTTSSSNNNNNKEPKRNAPRTKKSKDFSSKPAVGEALRAFHAIGNLHLAVNHLNVSIIHAALQDARHAAAASASFDVLVMQLSIRKIGDYIRRELVVHSKNSEIARFQQDMKSFNKGDIILLGARAGASPVESPARQYRVLGSSKVSGTEDSDPKLVKGRTAQRVRGTQVGESSHLQESGSKGMKIPTGVGQTSRPLHFGPDMDHVKRHKVVFRIPVSMLQMETKQELFTLLVSDASGQAKLTFLLQSTLFYKFVTDFKSAINVSTDLRDYKYLNEIISACQVSITSASTRSIGSPSSIEPTDGGAGKDPHSKQWSPRIDSKQPMEKVFKPDLEDNFPMLVFEPQLNVIGDASTMALEWVMGRLDVNKEVLPRHTHVYIVDSLESFLAEFHRFSRSLHKQLTKRSDVASNNTDDDVVDDEYSSVGGIDSVSHSGIDGESDSQYVVEGRRNVDQNLPDQFGWDNQEDDDRDFFKPRVNRTSK